MLHDRRIKEVPRTENVPRIRNKNKKERLRNGTFKTFDKSGVTDREEIRTSTGKLIKPVLELPKCFPLEFLSSIEVVHGNVYKFGLVVSETSFECIL